MRRTKNQSDQVPGKRNHVLVVTKPRRIQELDSQALDGFKINRTEPSYYIQKMGVINILPTFKRYTNQLIHNQIKMIYPVKPKILAKEQSRDKIILKGRARPLNYIKKQNNFKIIQKAKKKVIMKAKVENFLIEKKNTLVLLFEKLQSFSLPTSGKYFNNKPELKINNSFKIEYMKIREPFKFEKIKDVFIPLVPKEPLKLEKTVDVFIPLIPKEPLKLEKIEEVFIPLIPKKPLKLEKIGDIFIPLIPKEPLKSEKIGDIFIPLKPKEPLKSEKIGDIFIPLVPKEPLKLDKMQYLFLPLVPKKIKFKEDETQQISSQFNFLVPIKDNTILNMKIGNIFLPGRKKRYLTNSEVESLNYIGTGTDEYGLEIINDTDIFIPNVYDMLLIQNFWDNLEMKSFNIQLDPIYQKEYPYKTRKSDIKDIHKLKMKNHMPLKTDKNLVYEGLWDNEIKKISSRNLFKNNELIEHTKNGTKLKKKKDK